MNSLPMNYGLKPDEAAAARRTMACTQYTWLVGVVRAQHSTAPCAMEETCDRFLKITSIVSTFGRKFNTLVDIVLGSVAPTINQVWVCM